MSSQGMVKLNKFPRTCVRALAPAISVAGSLTSLDLSYNNLRADGAKALVDGARDEAEAG